MDMRRQFLDALADHIARRGLTRKAVAEGASVSIEQIHKALQRHNKGVPSSMNADDALRISDFFGMTLNEFVEDDLAEDRFRLARTYLRLSSRERVMLRALERELPSQPPEEAAE